VAGPAGVGGLPLAGGTAAGGPVVLVVDVAVEVAVVGAGRVLLLVGGAVDVVVEVLLVGGTVEVVVEVLLRVGGTVEVVVLVGGPGGLVVVVGGIVVVVVLLVGGAVSEADALTVVHRGVTIRWAAAAVGA
jgi:hypothetical protein